MEVYLKIIKTIKDQREENDLLNFKKNSRERSLFVFRSGKGHSLKTIIAVLSALVV